MPSWAARNFQRGIPDSGDGGDLPLGSAWQNGLPIGDLDGLDDFDVGTDGSGLDPGIRHYVLILRSQGIETCQSCEGGDGHAYPEPTIEFWGGRAEGLRAVAVAMAYGLPVAELRRVWNMQDGELIGPIWAITFSRKKEEERPGPMNAAAGGSRPIVGSGILDWRNRSVRMQKPSELTVCGRIGCGVRMACCRSDCPIVMVVQGKHGLWRWHRRRRRGKRQVGRGDGAE